MNTLREFVLIASTALWMGGLFWIVSAIIATGVVAEENVASVAPRASYYVFGAGVIVFIVTTFFWKKKKDP